MTNDPFYDDFKRSAELLIERGFARSFLLYDDARRMSKFTFTPEGLTLRKHLRKLFDIPNVNPTDLTPDAIADIIMVILLTDELS